METPSLELILPDSAATEALGASLVRCLQPGMLILLKGELGSGKTTLVRSLLHALGVKGHVKSPTYAILESYSVSSLYLYHFDFYRINEPGELEDAGLRDYFSGAGICLVEWPEKAGNWLPPGDLLISLESEGAGRRARLQARSPKGAECIEPCRHAGFHLPQR